jgi:hypothetical protein
MGFSNVTCLDILIHLRTTYGIVTPEDLHLNLKNLSRQWNPIQPLSNLWNQIQKCQDIAVNTEEPINDATVLRLTITNLENSGAFPHDVRNWHKLPAAHQTLGALKLHFNVANNKRTCILGSKSAGYANIATPVPPLVPQPTTFQPSAHATISTSHTYCWSHGFNLHPGRQAHTSKACKQRLSGHCKTATLLDCMGSCNLIQSGIWDTRVVWVHPPNPINNQEDFNPN